uniref:Putative ovule protein n=1 Tax=Solanum chacoense TaxID=4108 RepID=A0A0V0HEX5_SOLCH
MEIFDLEKQFAFYGAYHSNPVNILIHMVFVWPILFTALILFDFTPSLFNLPPIQLCEHSSLVLNYGFLFTLGYALFYVCLDKKAGSLAALLCLICWVSSGMVARQLGFSLAWKVVLAAQLFCWTGQFIGHGVFEKRAPALLDNLAQAFLMAPFFVLLEALQFLFGYEPYPGFHSKVKATIDAEIKEWQEKKQKKIS